MFYNFVNGDKTSKYITLKYVFKPKNAIWGSDRPIYLTDILVQNDLARVSRVNVLSCRIISVLFDS